MTIQMLTPYSLGRYTIPAGVVVGLFDAATEAGLIAAKQAIASAAAANWTVPVDNPRPATLTEDQVEQTQALVSGAVVYANTAFSGTSNNATTYLQGLIDAASAAYSVATGRVRLVIPPAIWMVDGLVWRSNVWYDWGDAIIRKRSAGASPFNRIIGTPTRAQNLGTYYGQSDNIKSTGGRFEVNGQQCLNGTVVLDEGRNCELSGFTVVHSPGVPQWAVQISGQNIQIGGDWRVLGGSELFQDGLHIKYGRDITVTGGYVESGDDALAFGWDISAASQAYDDEALENVTVTGTVVKAANGSGIKVYYGVDTPALGGVNRRRVRNLTVTGVTGSSGANRNGGIALIDGAGGSPSLDATQLQDIRIQAQLRVGGAAHSGVNAYGIWMTTGQRVEIDAALAITDTTGGATRFRPMFIQCGDTVRIKLKQTGLTELSSSINPFAAGTPLSDICIYDSDISATNLDGSSGIDINNSPGATMRGISIVNSVIRNIRDTSYGILTGPANVVGDLRIAGNRFYKRSGATSARAYAAGSASSVTHLELSGNDFTDVFSPTLGSFNTQHASYYVHSNRGYTSQAGGTATITAAATSVAVNHGAGVRLAAATSAAIPQISVVPTNAPTNAIKWSVSISADTGFTINSDVAPGASTATFAWRVDTSKKPVA